MRGFLTGWQEWRAFHSPAESSGYAGSGTLSTPNGAEKTRNIVPPDSGLLGPVLAALYHLGRIEVRR